MRAQHVAITQDGIRYAVEKHKKDCRMDCQDQGKVTKTVPESAERAKAGLLSVIG